MNIKRTIVSSFAALGIAMSVMAPAALAQPPSESTTGNNDQPARVTINDTGAFDVFLASGITGGLDPITGGWTDFGTVNLDAQSPEADPQATFFIWYTDTMAWRPPFDVRLSSTVPTSTTSSATIARTNMTIASTTDIGQVQWSGTTSYDIGDIGTFQNEAYTAQNSGPYSWTTNNSMNQARRVHFGYEGVGTIESGGGVDMQLHIPAGTDPAIYTWTYTVQVIAGSQP